MDKQLKRPDGVLIEEYKTVSAYVFKDGQLEEVINDEKDGVYTGRFYWEYPDGRFSRTYTDKTAPKWLLALYYEVTSGG